MLRCKTQTLINVPFIKATDAGYKPLLTGCLALKAVFVTLFYWLTRNLRLSAASPAKFYERKPVYRLPAPTLSSPKIGIYYLYFLKHRFRKHIRT